MVFSDTTGKTGIIQRCEEWTGIGDAGISGNTLFLAQFTAKLNDAFDEIMPYLLSYTDKGRWDDANNTDFPIATFNLVSGQNDYSVKVDGDSLDILRITDVQILESASATTYTTLRKMTAQDDNALDAMAPSSTDTGTPASWLERDNAIFLNPNPNYNATNGVKIFFERIESYFTATGNDTKTPGIPRIFHPLLVYIASRDWLGINEPDSVNRINLLNQKIAKAEQDLSDLISKRNPFHARMNVSTTPAPGANGWVADSNK